MENEELKQALGLTDEELREFLGNKEKSRGDDTDAQAVGNRQKDGGRGIGSDGSPGFQGFPPLAMTAGKATTAPSPDYVLAARYTYNSTSFQWAASLRSYLFLIEVSIAA